MPLVFPKTLVLMLESHELGYLFCQVVFFSCHHWQRELFQAFTIQQQVRVTFDCICVARTSFQLWR